MPLNPQPWYAYQYGDQFGARGGAEHGIDIDTPLDTPFTAPLSGTVTDVSSAPWGYQVTWQLDNPIQANGHSIPYAYVIHLDALNPQIDIGSHIERGATIGWTGGANSQAQRTAAQANSPFRLPSGLSQKYPYPFIDSPSSSGGVHTEFGLSYGPKFGTGAGWQDTATHPELNPKSIVDSLRNGGNDFTSGLIAGAVTSATGSSAAGIASTQCAPWDLACMLNNAHDTIISWSEHIAIFTLAIVLVLIGIYLLAQKQVDQVASGAARAVMAA